MVDIPLPRLLNSSGVFIRRIRPLKVSIEENIVPLSSASIQLPEDESLPARYFMELFTPNGSAGIYRIRSPQNAYGEDISVAELEHAIVEVGDYLVREKIAEMMTPQAALQRIFTHYRGSRWQLSENLSALGDTQVAVQVNYDNILTAILSIIEQIPSCYMIFNFSTSPRWTVGFATRGTTVSAEGRLSRNVQSAKIIYDDSELCTKAYYEVEITNASGKPDTEWRSLESDYMGRYGTVEREVSISAGVSEAEALKIAQEYLSKHEKPRLSIEIGGQELSHITGEQFDTFKIGKLFRLVMVDYDLTVEDVITGLIWDDVYGKPTEVTVKLADEEDTTVTYIHDVETKGGRSGGSGGLKKRIDRSNKEYNVLFETQNDSIIAKVSKGDVATQLAVECGNVHISGSGGGANLIVDGYIKTSELSTAIANITDGITVQGTLNAGTVDAHEVEGAIFRGGLYYFDETSLMNVYDASVENGVLTIYKRQGGNVSFSRATTLVGGWSGGVYTVTATPQGNVDLTTLAGIQGHWGQTTGVTTEDENKYYGEIKATRNSSGALINTEKEVVIDATSRYNAGYTDGRASVQTITPTAINVYTSQQGTLLSTRLSQSILTSGKFITLRVGNTTYSIQIT